MLYRPGRDLSAHIQGIILNIKNAADRAKDAGKKLRLFVFIHGGLNDYEGSVGRMVRDIGEMIRFKDPEESFQYYPLFLVWPSGIETYSDALVNYNQGEWDHFNLKSLLAPIRVGANLADAVTHAFLNYTKASARFLETHRIEKSDDPVAPGPMALSCRCQDEPKSAFSCIDTKKEEADRTREELEYTVATPFRLLAVPFLDPVGKEAWESMLARARFAMRYPCRDVNDRNPDSCQDGVFKKLFEALRNNVFSDPRYPDITLTLVGHSMGAIVTSELVREFPDGIPYDDVVFLAPAVSIREFLNSVETTMRYRLKHSEEYSKAQDQYRELRRTLKRIPSAGSARGENKLGSFSNKKGRQKGGRNSLEQDSGKAMEQLREFKERLRPPPPFHFYNISLHPFADASEKNLFGLAPNGSLLEWIDGMYETPADFLGRTMGKWRNVLSVKNVFNRELIAGGYIRFLRYDLSCDSPLKHGEVASSKKSSLCSPNSRPQYWDPSYWRKVEE